MAITYSAAIDPNVTDVLGKWMASSDGSSFYQELIKRHRQSQTVLQLALHLTSLLSYKKFLPNTSTNTVQSERSSLLSFDDFIYGVSITNERQVIEDMVLSLAQELENFLAHQNVVQFLYMVVDRDVPLKALIMPGRYWAKRVWGYSHDDAFKMAEQFEIKEEV